MHYKQIIWDWNGTLIDDTWMCIEVINELLSKYKKPTLTLEIYHKVFDFPVQNYYQLIGFDFNETPFEIVGSEFMNRYWQRWRECKLHHGARDFLGELQQHEIPQVIISAAETRLLQSCVDFFGIAHFFHELWGLDHHYATSKEGLVREFVNSSGLDPKEIVLIGDTKHDYEAARAAGVDCVLIARGHHPRHKLEQCRVPVFDSLRQARNSLKDSKKKQ